MRDSSVLTWRADVLSPFSPEEFDKCRPDFPLDGSISIRFPLNQLNDTSKYLMSSLACSTALFALVCITLVTLVAAKTPLIEQGPDVYALTPDDFEMHLSQVHCVHWM